jgi:hypothetical protein
MIDNAKTIPNGTELQCDFCLVGAGAAGVTLALELAREGRQVILLEAGGKKNAGKSLQLYEGELEDPDRHLPLDRDRYRQLGGTTALWGGRCLPFDPIDFQRRDYVPYSDWPVTAEEMQPFFKRSHPYLECGRFNYNSIESMPNAPREMISGFPDGNLVTTTIERWSPPTHFGKRYAKEMAALANLRVLLDAVCVGIELAPPGDHVRAVRVSTFSGNSFSIRAGQFTLCGGGLEVTRLLLASNDVQKGGIGNHSDWLGRCYQCHLSGVVAKATFRSDVEVIYGYEMDDDEIYTRRRLWLSPEAQEREQILNTNFLLDRPLIVNPEHGSGLLSLAFFTKNLSQGKRHLVPGKGKYALYWAHARNILKGSPEILSFLPQFFRKRFLHDRRIPSLILRSKSNSYHLYYHAEQIPNRESRITLSAEKDFFGMPRIHLDYRVTDFDVESVYRAHVLIARELERSGCGRLDFIVENPRRTIRDHQAVLGHHIGTTRMSRDSGHGVVDANCVVHGVDNLSIASSSTFPTSSQANPTLMIVAMAIRLASYLQKLPRAYDTANARAANAVR